MIYFIGQNIHLTSLAHHEQWWNGAMTEYLTWLAGGGFHTTSAEEVKATACAKEVKATACAKEVKATACAKEVKAAACAKEVKAAACAKEEPALQPFPKVKISRVKTKAKAAKETPLRLMETSAYF